MDGQPNEGITMTKRSEHEYVSRMAAQRQALNLVNSFDRSGEQLNGLSRHAIQRWFDQSSIPEKLLIKSHLEKLSSKLSFLANESQQQITPTYRATAEQYFEILNDLQSKLYGLK